MKNKVIKNFNIVLIVLGLFTIVSMNAQQTDKLLKVEKTNVSEDDIVNIPDEHLKASLVKEFDKNSDGKIQKTEAIVVTSIDVSNQEISNLTGIEEFTSLKNLDINSNEITDISVLSGLMNLKHLNLNSNEIIDISSL